MYEPLLDHRSHSLLPFSMKQITILQIYLYRVSLNNWICFYGESLPYHFYPVQDWMLTTAIDAIKDRIRGMHEICQERGEPPFPNYYTI